MRPLELMLVAVRSDLAGRRLSRTKLREQLKTAEDEVGRLELLEHALMYALGQTGSPHPKRDGLHGWRIGEKATEVLRTAGEPLHYREVWKRMAKTGVTIASSEPEAVLLTALTRHPDVERTARGVYGLRNGMSA